MACRRREAGAMGGERRGSGRRKRRGGVIKTQPCINLLLLVINVNGLYIFRKSVVEQTRVIDSSPLVKVGTTDKKGRVLLQMPHPLYLMFVEHSKGLDYCNGLLTEVKEKTSEGTLYNRQHNWLLFSSFTLMMANRLNQKEKTGY